MGELFSYKSRAMLVQNVIGDNSLLKKLDPTKAEDIAPRLERNAARFADLPEAQKEDILQSYNNLQTFISRTFMDKFKRSLSIMFIEVSPYELGWIFFSVVISILLLKRVEGAIQATWILPLLVLIFCFDNQMKGKEVLKSDEEALFPSEELIKKRYVSEISHNLTEYQVLMKGWNRYLIEEWAHEKPSNEKEVFELQAEKGEFYFNVARLQLKQQELLNPYRSLHEKKSLLLLFFYLLWNVFFAFFQSRRLHNFFYKIDRMPSAAG